MNKKAELFHRLMTSSKIKFQLNITFTIFLNSFLSLSILVPVFTINSDYSVENALITMIMISFLTPNIIDSLIWTIPNIISIFIRPYLIRHVHKVHKTHRVRSEALIMNFFLFLGALGGFIIAQSTLMNDSKKGFHVILYL